MASKIIFSNLSRNDDYTILLNGQARGTVLPLKTNTIDLDPGKYELDIKGSNEEGLPSMCKPIQVKIDDCKSVHLQIVAQHFAIGIYDEKGNAVECQAWFPLRIRCRWRSYRQSHFMNIPDNKPQQTFLERIRHRFIGAPRNINEPSLFHKISLIPVLAWIGLGADGLSSSSYGPEEAFKALGPHTYLAIFIAIATAFTVFIIAYAYSRIIEHFPHGGGGYMVATHTISSQAGVVAGSALLVDYILTITVSLASCGDAIFSFLPPPFCITRCPFVVGLIILLVFLNLRGVKESITFLAPIFIVFVVHPYSSHRLWPGNPFGRNRTSFGKIPRKCESDLSTIGFVGIMAIFLRAFSMGGGTYTGIEAVSNAMNVMREPKVQTGKRTMVYLAVSLAVTASGLLFCYALFSIKPIEGRTLNAILADRTFSGWYLGGTLALITILSEGALLMVGAQAGFIDGPRVMANMAVDSWLPRRFSALSERLTMQNGVLLMGAASLAVLFYTNGSVSALVVMYSINVFLTFSLSQFGMAKFFFQNRHKDKDWARHIVIHLIGLILCVTILIVTVYEKFGEGGWVTLVITSALIGLCYLIRRHYLKVRQRCASA